MLAEWSSFLDTGLSEIDEQHRELFSRINRLLDATRAGRGTAEIGNTITFLQDYVLTHFGTEEAYMRQVEYPAYEAHKRLHEGFVAGLELIRKQYEKEGATSPLVIQVESQVIDWLKKHIGMEDKAFGVYFRARAGNR